MTLEVPSKLVFYDSMININMSLRSQKSQLCTVVLQSMFVKIWGFLLKLKKKKPKTTKTQPKKTQQKTKNHPKKPTKHKPQNTKNFEDTTGTHSTFLYLVHGVFFTSYCIQNMTNRQHMRKRVFFLLSS